jgi:lambda family phage minor tail protein L
MVVYRNRRAQELAAEELIDLYELDASKYGGGLRYWTAGPMGEGALNLCWNAQTNVSAAGWSANGTPAYFGPARLDSIGSSYVFQPGNLAARWSSIPADVFYRASWLEETNIAPGMWAQASAFVAVHRARIRVTIEFLQGGSVIQTASSPILRWPNNGMGTNFTELRLYTPLFVEAVAPAGAEKVRFCVEVSGPNAGSVGTNSYAWFTQPVFAITPMQVKRALAFTPGTKGSQVRFNGITYQPVPVRLEGLQKRGRGPVPRLTVVVPDVDKLMTMLLATYGNLLGCKITRRQVFRSALDDGENADPTDFFGPEIFYIDRIVRHSPGQEVVIECASPLDIQGTMLPGRQMVRDVCSHTYRLWNGATFAYGSCPYAGGAMFRADNSVTGSVAEDRCAKSLNACRLRFGTSAPLPFRGFPGMGRSRL